LHTNSTLTWNLDIWVKIESWKDNLKIFWFPFKEHITNYVSPDNKYLLEEIKLEPWVKISWTTTNWLFLYKAISWSWVYKSFTPDSNNKIIFWVWLGGTTSGFMTKKIEYYTKTYISDIK
jgi:hypothetical protein